MGPRVLCDVQSLIADRRTAPLRVAWRLAESGRQLDANLVNLAAGERIDQHTEADLDVLVVVLAGAGTVDTVRERVPIGGGQLVWLPRGSTRSVLAGDDGLSYLTLHRRRPGMWITSTRRAETDAATHPAVSTVQSGLGTAEARVSTTTVTDNPGAARYEFALDGASIGFVEYHLHDRVIALLHTEIAPEYRNRGLGAILVKATLDDVRDRGLSVQPFCGFVRDFIADNEEYRSLVSEADRPRFQL